jgi:hypothetical protein
MKARARRRPRPRRQTPPTVTILQPTATTYPHFGTLTLNYSASDDESGVKSVTATLDGKTTVGFPTGHGLANGQVINLLTEMTLGGHTFVVTAVDNAGNNASLSVTFSIIVTAQSIIDEVSYFVSIGAITQDRGASLLKKLQAAAAYRAAGDCKDANETYQAFINELMAQSDKKVNSTAATTMILDAQYLMAHCP